MASHYRKFPLPPRLRCRWAFVLLACLLPLSSQAAHLEFVSEVDGTITDVTQTRTMFFTMENGWPTLKVHNRNSGSVRTIPPIEGEIPVNEWLTYRGAIFGWTSDVGTAVQEWTGGALRLYDGTPRGLQVAPVARQYAIWPIWIAGQGRFLHLRDMLLLQNHRVGNGSVNDLADVSDSGEVVFTQGPAPYNVFRYRNGQTTQLTNAQAYSHFNPLTDGTNVVYRKQVSDTSSQIVMYSDATGEIVLRPASGGFFTPRVDYLPSGGNWVAFTRINTVEGASVRQVWLRSLDGQISPISDGNTDAYIHAVSYGQVMFVSDGYLYLGRPGASPELITPFATGTQAVAFQGDWYVFFGSSLYRVVL